MASIERSLIGNLENEFLMRSFNGGAISALASTILLIYIHCEIHSEKPMIEVFISKGKDDEYTF
jgi:hypothetical protein